MGIDTAVSLGLTQALADLRYLRLTGGTLTGPLTIGSTLAAFPGTLLVSDGTPLGPNDDTIATFIGQLLTRSTAAAGHFTGLESVMRVTAAGAGQAIDAMRGYAWATHTSGTVATLRATLTLIDLAGAGGTTAAATAHEIQLFAAAGAIATTLRGVRIRNGSLVGATIGTQVMLDIDAVSAASAGAAAANIAIRTAGGTVQIILPTSAAGLTSGQWWNNAGVPNIVP